MNCYNGKLLFYNCLSNDAKYWLTNNVNARGLVRYQGADFDGLAENAVIGNAGLNFQF